MGENVGFLGAGDVFMRVKGDDGTWGGWANTGGANKFEVKAESEIKSQISKGRTTYGQATDAVTLPKEPAIDIEFTRPNRRVIAATLLGTDSAVSVTGATVSSEAHDAPAVGDMIRTAYGNISAVTITSGGSPLVAGTDYVITDAVAGMITNLTEEEGTAWTVAYTYASEAGFKVKGVTRPKFNCQFLLVGKNMVDGTPCRCEVWDAQIAPSGGWDFLSDDYSKVALAGTCNTPTSKDAPYEVTIMTE